MSPVNKFNKCKSVFSLRLRFSTETRARTNKEFTPENTRGRAVLTTTILDERAIGRELAVVAAAAADSPRISRFRFSIIVNVPDDDDEFLLRSPGRNGNGKNGDEKRSSGGTSPLSMAPVVSEA